MRLLLWITVVAALAWAGYWFVGARAVTQGLTVVQTQAEDTGLTLRFTPEINGFPNRFDLTLTDPLFRDPASGIGWQAPFLQLFMLSYQPHRLIAVWPDTQTLTVGGQQIAITSTDMRASAALRPRPSLPLDQVIFIAQALRIGPEGAGLGLDTLRLALRDAGGDAGYDLGAEVLGLAPDPALLGAVLASLPQGTALPDRLDRLHLDARVALDRLLDRIALQRWTDRAEAPRLTEINLKEARLVWGGLEMTASGTLTVGTDGVLSGQIDTQTTGWQVITPLAVAGGLVRPEVAETFANALRVLAGLSEPINRLDAPLILQDGRMSFGPLDLGPAPRLR